MLWLSPFYKWGSQGTEQLRGSAQVTGALGKLVPKCALAPPLPVRWATSL